MLASECKFETEHSRLGGGDAPIRSPILDRYLVSAASSEAKDTSYGLYIGSSLVRVRCGRVSNSSTVGFLVGNVEVTPWRDSGIT